MVAFKVFDQSCIIEIKMFIGRIGTKNIDAYNKARKLLLNGVDSLYVRQQTGFFLGLDGELREEISDKYAKINHVNLNKIFSSQHESGYLDALWYKIRDDRKYSISVNRFEPNSSGSYFEKLGIFTKDDLMNTFNLKLVQAIINDNGIDSKKGRLIRDNKMRIITSETLSVRDIFEHDDLYERYPEIAETPVYLSESPSFNASTSTKQDGSRLIKISLNLKQDLILARKVILHELQHLVQYREDWSIGSSSNRFVPVDRTLYDITKIQSKLNKLLKNESSGDTFYNFLKVARELTYKYPNKNKNSFDIEKIPDQELEDFIKIQDRLDEINPEILALHGRIDTLIEEGSGIVNAFDQYEHSAGEIEARLVMGRSEMTDVELYSSTPYTNSDYENASVFRNSYDQMVVKDGYMQRKTSMKSSMDEKFADLLFNEDSVGVDAMYGSSYIFLKAYSQLAKSNVSPVITNDFQAILDWDLGFGDGRGTLSLSLAKRFAKAFESYILYAVAPKQIENQLGTFKVWIEATALKLDPRIADIGAYEALYPIFNRMLGSMDAADMNPFMAEVMAAQIMEATDTINYELAYSTGIVYEAFYQSISKNTGLTAESIREKFAIGVRGDDAPKVKNDHLSIKRQFGLPI